MFSYKIDLILKDNEAISVSGGGVDFSKLRDYYIYLTHLFTHHKSFQGFDYLLNSYQDVFQLPLQPLRDNLQSQTYECFEEDITKYELYEKAVSWTGLVNGWYNIVTFLSALALAGFAKKYGAKSVHMICLILAAAGFFAFPHIENKNLLFFAISGFGIGWASMMGIPYLLVVSDIPKERYGVYMGIINMMIVVPMILQNLSFGFILKHLDNDPRNAITFAGALLAIAALATAFIKPSPSKQSA